MLSSLSNTQRHQLCNLMMTEKFAFNNPLINAQTETDRNKPGVDTNRKIRGSIDNIILG